LPGPSPVVEASEAAVHQVLTVVRGALVDVIGPEYLVGLSIEMGTSFDKDLDLDSLEFVALAERLLA
jgi:acyl carrier protein